MKYYLLSICCVLTMLLCAGKLHAQEELDSITQTTFDEGKALSKLIYTEAVGVSFVKDLYTKHLQNHKSFNFPYEEGDKHKFVLLNLDQTPKVVLSVSFKKDYDEDSIIIEKEERNLTPQEAKLYHMYQLAEEKAVEDTSFVTYEDAEVHYKVVPTRYGYKAFYYPIATNDTDLIIGHDYSIEFDSLDHVISKKMLHKTLTGMKLLDPEHIMPDTGYILNTFTGTENELAATDVAFALLYHKAANYQDYFLVNKSHLYILDCVDETIEAWDMAQFYLAYSNKKYKGKYRVRKLTPDQMGHFQLDPLRYNLM